MTWVLLAIFAYFLLSLVDLIDKKILSSPSLNPLTYAFYTGLLGSLALFFWLFDFSFLSFGYTIIALLAGAAFFVATLFLYGAIIRGEVSRVISIVGGLSPILVFVFSVFFLGEKIHTSSFIALLMLVSGSVLLSFVSKGNKFEFGRYFFLLSFLAAFFFAASYGLTKAVFLKTTFLNGFVWMRIGALICCLFVFLEPKSRKIVSEGIKGFSQKLTTLFLFNKGISALAHLILNYAVKLGSVAIVSALQSVQYAFIFILTLGLSYFLPRVFYESLAPKRLITKMTGIFLVSLGVAFLFLDF